MRARIKTSIPAASLQFGLGVGGSGRGSGRARARTCSAVRRARYWVSAAVTTGGKTDEKGVLVSATTSRVRKFRGVGGRGCVSHTRAPAWWVEMPSRRSCRHESGMGT